MKIDKCGICDKVIESGDFVVQLLHFSAYFGTFNGQVLKGMQTKSFAFIGSDNRHCHLDCLKTAFNMLEYSELSAGQREYGPQGTIRPFTPKVDNV